MAIIRLDVNNEHHANISVKSDKVVFDLPPELKHLLQYAKFEVDGTILPVTEDGVSLNRLEGREIKVYLDSKQIASFTVDKNASFLTVTQQPDQYFTTFLFKSLSLQGRLPEVKNPDFDANSYSIRTDLHTHYPGAMNGRALVDIATASGNPFYYPTAFLQTAGVDTSVYKKVSEQVVEKNGQKSVNNVIKKSKDHSYIDIQTLDESDREKLIQCLSVPKTKQIIFDTMEEYYDFRKSFTQEIKFFKEYLISLAQEYQKHGVTDVSLSHSKMTDPKWLEIADQVVPDIEREYGVKFRFLVSISRLLTVEEQLDRIQEFDQVGSHPLIEGIDFLAGETNSTYDFYPSLHMAAGLGDKYPGMVIRVHAGETMYHPENVTAAIVIADQYKVKVRVGHGIYGVDEETLELAKKLSDEGLLIIEMNPDSNFALNMIDQVHDYPLIAYSKNGVAVALGSDGTGLYQTDAKQLLHFLRYLPCDPEEVLTAIKKGEGLYVDTAKATFTEKSRLHQARLEGELTTLRKRYPEKKEEELRKQAFQNMFKPLREEKKFATKKMLLHHKQRLDKRNHMLTRNLSTHEVVWWDKEKIKKMTKDKTPIMITGSLPDSTSDEEFEKFQAMVSTLLKNLDPTKVYFTTSGNDHGLQKILHHAIQEHNQKTAGKSPPFVLMGYLAHRAKPEDVTPHLDCATMDYSTWYDLHGHVAKKIVEDDLKLIIAGGGMLTRDIIQAVYNSLSEGDRTRENKNIFLIQGPLGASTSKGKHMPEQYQSRFETAAIDLYKANPELFNQGLTTELLEEDYSAEATLLTEQGDLLRRQQGPIDALQERDIRFFLKMHLEHHRIAYNKADFNDYIDNGCNPQHKFVRLLHKNISKLGTRFFSTLNIDIGDVPTTTPQRPLLSEVIVNKKTLPLADVTVKRKKENRIDQERGKTNLGRE